MIMLVFFFVLLHKRAFWKRSNNGVQLLSQHNNTLRLTYRWNFSSIEKQHFNHSSFAFQNLQSHRLPKEQPPLEFDWEQIYCSTYARPYWKPIHSSKSAHWFWFRGHIYFFALLCQQKLSFCSIRPSTFSIFLKNDKKVSRFWSFQTDG